MLSIAEDKMGNIWFGTQRGGVSRYNAHLNTKEGHQKPLPKTCFTNFTTAQGLANNTVWSIAEDRNGNIWFGTNGGGVSRYDGNLNDESLTTQKAGATPFTNFTTVQGLGNNTVQCITEDKGGNIWFGTNAGGASCYDVNLANNPCNKNTCSHDLQIPKDIQAHNIGLSKSFASLTVAQGLPNNNVWSITEDKNGNLWFGTRGGGVSRYEGKSFASFTTAQGLANNTVWSIAEDKSGNLWFGTQGGGASCYDGISFTGFTTAQGLGGNIVFCINNNKNGNLWFGTQGGGVSLYDGRSFTSFTTAQGLANNTVCSITEDKNGSIWFGTYGGGVSRFDGKYFNNFTTAQGLVSNEIFSSIEDKNGNIWFGTNGSGVSRYNQNRANNTCNKNTCKHNLRIQQNLQEHNAELAKCFTSFTTAQGLSDNSVWSIIEDRSGNLWFGTYGGGISRFDGKSFFNITTANGLGDDVVNSIVEDQQGIIWFGTNLGFSGLKFESPKFQDKKREIMGAGLVDASNEELKAYKPVWEIYNNNNGYPVKDINGGSNNGAMLCDKNGIIWAGTGDDKVIRFDPKEINKDKSPPALFIQSVKINGEKICWYNMNETDSVVKSQQGIMTYGNLLSAKMCDSISKIFSDVKFDGISKWYPLPENLTLPYEHNNITFDFVAIETGRNFLVRYQYILEGYDKEWSPVTDKTSATFGNIFEGTYTFKLKARSPEGIWGQPVEYAFRVLPPWWRTWWMYTLYGVFAIGLVVLIVLANGFRLRKKAKELTFKIRKATQEVKVQQEVIREQQLVLKEQQIKELELIAIRAQMNPHFLFNVLASIQMLINKSDIVAANNALAKFGKLMRLILQNSEKQTIFLYDEIEMLKLYVELESLLLSFNCKIMVDPLLDVENIPVPTMIIQPYVENAIKHGISGLVSDREVIVSFQKREDSLFCSIQDNGIGRQMAQASKSKYSEHKSMGTRLSNDRVKIMNKQRASNVEVVIKDLTNDQGFPAGTLVELNLPISYCQN